LTGALFMVEELYQRIRQLMPQLSFPEVFEGEEKVLKVCRSSIALFPKEFWDRIDIHGGLRCDKDLETV